MRIAPDILLTDEERKTLLQWSRGRRVQARHVLRARIVLMAAEGKMNLEIAKELETSRQTVGLWRQRFYEQGLPGIEKDAPRGGRPSKPQEELKALIITKTTQEKPPNATHWSTRSLALDPADEIRQIRL